MSMIDPISRLHKDVLAASALLGRREARYLVDAYYTIQDYRKAASSQERALAAGDEPHAIITWLAAQMCALETQVKRVLGKWAETHPVGRWSMSICGIGPVISAGLLAHIDITRAPTVGHIWRFAGLDPTLKWEKGNKRPWNAALKVLCWKIGESFVKVKSKKDDIYGKIYIARKDLEIAKNNERAFADQADRILRERKIGKTTEAYKWYSQGMLPPAQIHARAKRYALKLFLSHWHHAAHVHHYGTAPPMPYVIEHGGHAHYIAPPHMDLLR